MARSKIQNILTVLTVAAAMASCNRNTVFYRYDHTPVAGWEKNDTLTFDVSPVPRAGSYREEIGLRINGSYPFTGLCLIVEQTIYPSGVSVSDTLNCRLIDADGTVRGRGVSYYQYSFHLTDMRLEQGDSLHVCVRHNMKREILPGISDIGLRVVSVAREVAAGVDAQEDEKEEREAPQR